MKISNLRTILGLARSVLMYYAIPGRYGRMRRFYSQFIQPDDLCFDVGGHVGNRVRAWLALGAQVVVVEPQPVMLRWLRWLYGSNDRVTLIPAAVGAEPGVATLRVSSRTPTVSTLSTEWIETVQQDPSFAEVAWDTAVSVPVVTLDNLVSAHGQPAFCKLDVEGYELEALRGLSLPLRVLSFEHIPAAAELTLGCIARLGELDDYVYNFASGESQRLHFTDWLPADAMQKALPGLPSGSGDVYARRA